MTSQRLSLQSVAPAENDATSYFHPVANRIAMLMLNHFIATVAQFVCRPIANEVKSKFIPQNTALNS